MRLDGSTGVSKRQKLVDAFNQPGPQSFAFLLSRYEHLHITAAAAGRWYGSVSKSPNAGLLPQPPCRVRQPCISPYTDILSPCTHRHPSSKSATNAPHLVVPVFYAACPRAHEPEPRRLPCDPPR